MRLVERAVAKRLFILLAAVVPLACGPGQITVVQQPRLGGTDVTFFVAADTHLGAHNIEALNRIQIAAMNALPGRAYPLQLGGKVARPKGVLMAGDLTDNGRMSEWRTFVKLYGLTGRDALLKYPLYECTGNHDRIALLIRPVLDGVRKRHGRLEYSWDWQDVHIVCLDNYPDAATCRWLKRDLAAVGTLRPVVIYFHYPLKGPFSGPEWWRQSQKQAFGAAIDGYNVIGIFHGHYHGSLHYRWEGYDVYNVGSPRHSCHSFAVVRVTDSTMTVASWNWDYNRWAWTHSKPINAATRGQAAEPLRKTTKH